MYLVKADQSYAAGEPPTPALDAAIGKHIDDMTKAGVLVSVGGLAPPSQGTKIKARSGSLTVTDGPFTEAKEIIGGFAIMQVQSREHAIALGKEFLQLHVDVLGTSYAGEIEIRQVFGPED